MSPRPEIPVLGITLGDPRGIGPEVTLAALRGRAHPDRAAILVIGPRRFRLEFEELADAGEPVEFLEIDARRNQAPGSSARTREANPGDREAGELAARAIEAGIEMALEGRIDGLVTAPISKEALRAAGYPFPGHTEFLRERTGVEEVAMVMVAEKTPLGGPLRVALVTVHVPLRQVPVLLTVPRIVQRATIAARGLRDWWGIARPRLAFAGLNPHASEGGLFGDEEERVIMPAMERIARQESVDVSGPFPADTVFRRCIAGEADLVIVPYHDVGLAVLKTIAPDSGVNVTTGLPFPRTSPDHGTAFDIAGRGQADPSSMAAAIDTCTDFCQRVDSEAESA
ncbi:MAG: 4-hydroxythreonine-4-phosphate dehydrogenase PdxA [marine benthic group bacterium]|nr:4-hydroxythreonine-4-phosphate dehydrogenase PdxA [Gemmatimonadota bacterium]